MGRRTEWAIAAAVLLLSGCATQRAIDDTARLLSDGRFGRPATPVAVDDLFAVSPEMKRYFDHEIARRGEWMGPRQSLYQAMRQDLAIDYDAGITRNAAQTFAARSGNCISLVILTAAFAKALGVPVEYHWVHGFETWSRDSDFTFRNGHVNLSLSRPPRSLWTGIDLVDSMTIDFVPPSRALLAGSRPITEDTVVAMFLNNRAAELVVQGDLDSAYAWARAAVRRDSRFLPALNTLAVIYMRHGDLPQAEAVLRTALVREPQNTLILGNLALALERQGRVEDAAAVRAQLAAIEPYPPFWYLDQAREAMAHGDYVKARDLLQRELERMPYDDEVHFAVALANLHLGATATAREHLELAAANSNTSARHQLYEAKLEHLRTLQQ